MVLRRQYLSPNYHEKKLYSSVLILNGSDNRLLLTEHSNTFKRNMLKLQSFYSEWQGCENVMTKNVMLGAFCTENLVNLVKKVPILST